MKWTETHNHNYSPITLQPPRTTNTTQGPRRETVTPPHRNVRNYNANAARVPTADCRLQTADCANTTPTPRPTATTEQRTPYDDATTNLTPTQICTGHRADQLSGVC